MLPVVWLASMLRVICPLSPVVSRVASPITHITRCMTRLPFVLPCFPLYDHVTRCMTMWPVKLTMFSADWTIIPGDWTMLPADWTMLPAVWPCYLLYGHVTGFLTILPVVWQCHLLFDHVTCCMTTLPVEWPCYLLYGPRLLLENWVFEGLAERSGKVKSGWEPVVLRGTDGAVETVHLRTGLLWRPENKHAKSLSCKGRICVKLICEWLHKTCGRKTEVCIELIGGPE